MSNNTTASGGVGFFGLLTVLFIGLKLTDHVDWSWAWVLGPLWIPTTVFLGIAAVFFLLGGIALLIDKVRG